MSHILTDNQKRTSVETAKQLLKTFSKFFRKHFSNNATGEEKRFHNSVKGICNKI